MDLLESRYKLTETVIFNRTKVSLNAMLDRCLLEIRDIWARAGLPESEFQKQAVSDLIESSDEAVPNLLRRWQAGGGKREHRDAIAKIMEADRVALGAASGGQMSLLEASMAVTLDQFSAVKALIERLRDRQNYKLVFKLSRAQFASLDGRHEAFIKLYKATEKRRSYLCGVESLCRLPEGSLVSYFAPTRAMNAKVADVNLLLDGKVVAFAKHEADNKDEPARQLTSGTLTAQIERFKHLWSFQVFMERGVYDELTDSQRGALNDLLRGFLINMDGKPRNEFLTRRSLQAFVEPFQMQGVQAARLETQPPVGRTWQFRFSERCTL